MRQYMWLFDEACRDGVEDFLILSGEAWAGAWLQWQHQAKTASCTGLPRKSPDPHPEQTPSLSHPTGI